MTAMSQSGDSWSQSPEVWADLQEPMGAPLWEAMLDSADAGPSVRLFDAGCGGGGASVLAAERGASVSGLDRDRALIEIARKRVPVGDFRVGDLENIPFADDAFEIVFAANSLQFVSDRQAALREFRRVGSKGGKLVVGLWGLPETSESWVFFKSVGELTPEPPPGGGPYALSATGAMEQLMETAGIRPIDGGEVSCPFVYKDSAAFWRANMPLGPIQNALKFVSEEKLRTKVQEAIQPYQAPDGRIRMDNVFRYVLAVMD